MTTDPPVALIALALEPRTPTDAESSRERWNSS